MNSILARTYLIIALSAAILIATLAGGWWYLLQREQASETALPQVLQESWDHALSGDAEGAARQAASFLEGAAADDLNRVWARSILAESSFNAATTTAQMVEAVRMMKANFREAESVSLRASIANRLATAIYESQAREVYDEVFDGEPFAAYKKKLRNDSIKSLAEYSISLYPTSAAYLTLARQEANAIVVSLYPGSARPIDESSDARATAEGRVKRIAEYVAQADALIASDAQRAIASPYGVTVLPWHHFWRGYALGAAARIDDAYLASAEGSYRQTIDLAVSAKDAQGQSYPVLAIIATKAELAYARMLQAVSEDARGADVRTHLARFVSAIQSSEQSYRSFYNFFDTAKFGARAKPDAAYGTLYREYLEYKTLAAVSPELKAFLISRGWEL